MDVDPYSGRYRDLDRKRLSDELVTEVASALDADDRERVLFLTELLPPTDFDALSEMIADGFTPVEAIKDVYVAESTELDADVAFLLGTQSSVSKADGFINKIRAIFTAESDNEPDVHVHVTPAFQQSLASHCAASTSDDPGAADQADDSPPAIGIQKRFLEVCRESGASLTYLRVKKILVGEFGPDLFQRHRDFFVSHMDGTSRAIEEKENTPQHTDAGFTETPGVAHDRDIVDRPLSTFDFGDGGSVTPTSSMPVMEWEESGAIDHLSQMLVTAKAATAKAKWEEEEFRVYVRNRDRILAKVLRDANPNQSLSQDSVRLLLNALQDTIT
jgi:hypothetical protein